MIDRLNEVAAECELFLERGDEFTPNLEDLLVEAIYYDCLGKVLDKLNDEKAADIRDARILENASAALNKINADVEGHCVDIQTALKTTGIESHTDTSKSGVRQYHAFDLWIARRDLAAALAVLADAGYPLAAALQEGAVSAIGATQNKIELLQDASTDMRATLNWAEKSWGHRLPQKLVPTHSEFQVIQLPTAFWPLYVILRPLRTKLESWFDLKLRSQNDTVLSQVSLGTPHSLIAPLLNLVAIETEQKVVDLGCGDGRVIAQAMEHYGAIVLGIETNETLAARAKDRIAKANDGRSIVEQRLGVPDDVTDADVVFLFQPMHLAATLVPTLLERMKVGSRILMHEQTVLHPELKPDVSRPIFSDDAITVAHIWEKRP